MALERYWKSKLNLIQVILSLVGGLLLVYPGTLTDVIGIVLVGAAVLWQRFQRQPAS